ncbi:MAG: tryptophan--tRNA ligase [Candidatus Ancillula sp.]|jgi:tryptophanyl-tRNA synthetase|nr:tryptophan--tRNA ligase [Candidatus Ancillula sp.]
MKDRKTYSESLRRSKDLENAIIQNPQNYRILTGERPTGQLHIGHLFGSIKERVRLQKLGTETAIIIADYQVITDRDEFKNLKESVDGIVIDNLAAGLDPEKTMFFCHSQIPELNQLMIPFLSLVTEPELLRNPTVKAEMEASGHSLSGLLLTYPVHQACDILFCKGSVVPVGKDQLPHIEVCRLIAKRFNERFAGVKYGELDKEGNPKGMENAVFPLPEALLSKVPHVPGLDGRKMSKSFGNAVLLGMSADETAKLIKKTPTDNERTITYNPDDRKEVSSLLTITALCRGLEIGGDGEQQIAEEINSDPKFGAGLLKQKCTEAVNEALRDHREKRSELAENLDYVHKILHDGIIKAREIAVETLKDVQNAMGTIY